MILDTLEHASKYYRLSEGIKKGLEYILETDFTKIEDGLYEIDGKNIFAAIMTYSTKENGRYEAHDNYIDIQVILEGNGEIVKYIPVNELGSPIETNLEKDIKFYQNPDSVNELSFPLRKNQFAIFMPQDGHMPACVLEDLEQVRKVVVKVKIELGK